MANPKWGAHKKGARASLPIDFDIMFSGADLGRKYAKYFVVKYVPRQPPNLIRKREIQSPIRKPLKILVTTAVRNIRRIALRQYIESQKHASLSPRKLF